MSSISASPMKLRNGSWGAKAQSADVSAGDTLTITTRAGKSWEAQVTRVIWSGDGAAICATAKTNGRGRDSAGNARWNGDSYRAGVTAPRGRRCPECGSRECAKAWNSRDLCDDD